VVIERGMARLRDFIRALIFSTSLDGVGSRDKSDGVVIDDIWMYAGFYEE